MRINLSQDPRLLSLPLTKTVESSIYIVIYDPHNVIWRKFQKKKKKLNNPITIIKLINNRLK